jgi:uncharacterized phage-associated protein
MTNYDDTLATEPHSAAEYQDPSFMQDQPSTPELPTHLNDPDNLDIKYYDKQTYPAPAMSLTVFDVASYVLSKLPDKTCTTMKLQKLIYYCQAWSLVWDDAPLFPENIEAWANGPVVPELYRYHKGMFIISYDQMSLGNDMKLNKNQQETVDSVLAYYGDKHSQWLIDLTHMEAPWINARKGLSRLEKGNRIIKLDDMVEYYSSL